MRLGPGSPLLLLLAAGCFSPNASLSDSAETENATSEGSTTAGATGASGSDPTSGATTDGDTTSDDPPTGGDPTSAEGSATDSVTSSEADSGSNTTDACPNTEAGCPCVDGACVDLACVADECTEVPEGTVFIEGGTYTNGDNPQEERTVEDLFFDRTEVTVQAYEECVADNACEVPSASACLGPGEIPGDPSPSGQSNYSTAGRGLHPVNCVVYEEAASFCAWAGKRLPTEWEWEWAARGRAAGNVYPWGNAPEPSCKYCVGNFGDPPGCGTGEPAAVGSRSPAGDTAEGLQDMAGNIYEWTSTSDAAGTSRQLRGGGYTQDASYLRVDQRNWSYTTNRYDQTGFRCVVDP